MTYEDSMRDFRLFTNMSIPNLDTVLEILHVWYFIFKSSHQFLSNKKIKNKSLKNINFFYNWRTVY